MYVRMSHNYGKTAGPNFAQRSTFAQRIFLFFLFFFLRALDEMDLKKLEVEGAWDGIGCGGGGERSGGVVIL